MCAPLLITALRTAATSLGHLTRRDEYNPHGINETLPLNLVGAGLAKAAVWSELKSLTSTAMP